MSDAPSNPSGMSRRSLLTVVAIAAGVLIVGAALSRLVGHAPKPDKPFRPEEEARPASPTVRAYFGELVDGHRFGRWTLVHVFDVRDGAIPIVLATADGHRYQVDLLRFDPAGPRGVADTSLVSLFVSNGGDGGTSTPEEQAQGVTSLAAELTRREQAGAKPPPLSTLTERLSLPTRHFSVPLDR